jgi:hypothetical protein
VADAAIVELALGTMEENAEGAVDMQFSITDRSHSELNATSTEADNCSCTARSPLGPLLDPTPLCWIVERDSTQNNVVRAPSATML